MASKGCDCEVTDLLAFIENHIVVEHVKPGYNTDLNVVELFNVAQSMHFASFKMSNEVISQHVGVSGIFRLCISKPAKAFFKLM